MNLLLLRTSRSVIPEQLARKAVYWYRSERLSSLPDPHPIRFSGSPILLMLLVQYRINPSVPARAFLLGDRHSNNEQGSSF
jgi:hypothetical protein